MKLKTIVEKEGENLLQDDSQFSRNMSLFYAYKQKEAGLPEELKLSNAESFFGRLNQIYEAKLQQSTMLDDLKDVLSQIYPSEPCSYLGQKDGTLYHVYIP